MQRNHGPCGLPLLLVSCRMWRARVQVAQQPSTPGSVPLGLCQAAKTRLPGWAALLGLTRGLVGCTATVWKLRDFGVALWGRKAWDSGPRGPEASEERAAWR